MMAKNSKITLYLSIIFFLTLVCWSINHSILYAAVDTADAISKPKKGADRTSIKEFYGAAAVIAGALIAWGLPLCTNIITKRKQRNDAIRAAEIVCLGRFRKVYQALTSGDLPILKKEVRFLDKNIDSYLGAISLKKRNYKSNLHIYSIMATFVVRFDSMETQRAQYQIKEIIDQLNKKLRITGSEQMLNMEY